MISAGKLLWSAWKEVQDLKKAIAKGDDDCMRLYDLTMQLQPYLEGGDNSPGFQRIAEPLGTLLVDIREYIADVAAQRYDRVLKKSANAAKAEALEKRLNGFIPILVLHSSQALEGKVDEALNQRGDPPAERGPLCLANVASETTEKGHLRYREKDVLQILSLGEDGDDRLVYGVHQITQEKGHFPMEAVTLITVDAFFPLLSVGGAANTKLYESLRAEIESDKLDPSFTTRLSQALKMTTEVTARQAVYSLVVHAAGAMIEDRRPTGEILVLLQKIDPPCISDHAVLSQLEVVCRCLAPGLSSTIFYDIVMNDEDAPTSFRSSAFELMSYKELSEANFTRAIAWKLEAVRAVKGTAKDEAEAVSPIYGRILDELAGKPDDLSLDWLEGEMSADDIRALARRLTHEVVAAKRLDLAQALVVSQDETLQELWNEVRSPVRSVDPCGVFSLSRASLLRARETPMGCGLGGLHSLSEQLSSVLVAMLLESVALAGPPPTVDSEFTNSFGIVCSRTEPLKMAILSIGSGAYGCMTSHSDVEFCALVSSSNQDALDYVLRVCGILEAKTVLLGETSPSPQSSQFARGFMFDEAGNTPLGAPGSVSKGKGGTPDLLCALRLSSKGVGLLGCPHDIATFAVPEPIETHNLISSHALSHTSLLWGDASLAEQYYLDISQRMSRQENGVPVRAKLALRFLQEAVSREFCPPEIMATCIDVKKQLFRLPSMAILNIALLENMQSFSVASLSEILATLTLVDWEVRRRLARLLDVAVTLRNMCQLTSSSENTVVCVADVPDSFSIASQPHICTALLDVYYMVAVPLSACLKTFVANLEACIGNGSHLTVPRITFDRVDVVVEFARGIMARMEVASASGDDTHVYQRLFADLVITAQKAAAFDTDSPPVSAELVAQAKEFAEVKPPPQVPTSPFWMDQSWCSTPPHPLLTELLTLLGSSPCRGIAPCWHLRVFLKAHEGTLRSVSSALPQFHDVLRDGVRRTRKLAEMSWIGRMVAQSRTKDPFERIQKTIAAIVKHASQQLESTPIEPHQSVETLSVDLTTEELQEIEDRFTRQLELLMGVLFSNLSHLDIGTCPVHNVDPFGQLTMSDVVLKDFSIPDPGEDGAATVVCTADELLVTFPCIRAHTTDFNWCLERAEGNTMMPQHMAGTCTLALTGSLEATFDVSIGEDGTPALVMSACGTIIDQLEVSVRGSDPFVTALLSGALRAENEAMRISAQAAMQNLVKTTFAPELNQVLNDCSSDMLEASKIHVFAMIEARNQEFERARQEKITETRRKHVADITRAVKQRRDTKVASNHYSVLEKQSWKIFRNWGASTWVDPESAEVCAKSDIDAAASSSFTRDSAGAAGSWVWKGDWKVTGTPPETDESGWSYISLRGYKYSQGSGCFWRERTWARQSEYRAPLDPLPTCAPNDAERFEATCALGGALDYSVLCELSLVASGLGNVIGITSNMSSEDTLWFEAEVEEFVTMNNYSDPMFESLCRVDVAMQLCEALVHLDQLSMPHGAVRPRAVMIRRHPPFTLKLWDYGMFERTLSLEALRRGSIVDIDASPGDMIQPTSTMDVWAFASTIWEIFTQTIPFQTLSDDEFVRELPALRALRTAELLNRMTETSSGVDPPGFSRFQFVVLLPCWARCVARDPIEAIQRRIVFLSAELQKEQARGR